MQIVSLFDYTGEALKPWAEAGYECFAYDIQQPGTYRDGVSASARVGGVQSQCKQIFVPGGWQKIVPQIRGVFQL